MKMFRILLALFTMQMGSAYAASTDSIEVLKAHFAGLNYLFVDRTYECDEDFTVIDDPYWDYADVSCIETLDNGDSRRIIVRASMVPYSGWRFTINTPNAIPQMTDLDADRYLRRLTSQVRELYNDVYRYFGPGVFDVIHTKEYDNYEKRWTFGYTNYEFGVWAGATVETKNRHSVTISFRSAG